MLDLSIYDKYETIPWRILCLLAQYDQNIDKLLSIPDLINYLYAQNIHYSMIFIFLGIFRQDIRNYIIATEDYEYLFSNVNGTWAPVVRQYWKTYVRINIEADTGLPLVDLDYLGGI